MQLSRTEHHVLVVVDVQQDFCRDGALSVPDAESLIAPLNQAVRFAESRGMMLIYTRDWHPADHSSFKQQRGTWPPHCVMDTPGADFHPDLYIPNKPMIVNTGVHRDKEGYSPFEEPEMAELIDSNAITTVFVVGIALEYCVRATCLDARIRGVDVVAIEPLIRSLSTDPDEVEKTWRELIAHGVKRAKALPGYPQPQSAAREILRPT